MNKLIIDLSANSELKDAMAELQVGDQLARGSLIGSITRKDDVSVAAELTEVEHEGFDYTLTSSPEPVDDEGDTEDETSDETEAGMGKSKGESLLIVVGPDGKKKA